MVAFSKEERFSRLKMRLNEEEIEDVERWPMCALCRRQMITLLPKCTNNDERRHVAPSGE